jgi:hypothetical protein
MNRRIDELGDCPQARRPVQKDSTGKNKTETAMPKRINPDPMMSLEKLVTGLPTAEYILNVTVVYQDSQSRKWAGEIYQKLESILGAKSVRATWWNLADLMQPGVMAGAVSKAIRADMIVVAVSASEGLPLPFYFWVNAWLPNRITSTGALVGLLGLPVPRTSESGRLRKFLRVVARRTRLDLLVAERCAVTATEAPVEVAIKA